MGELSCILMHVNDLLQYGVKILVITSFKDTCYIEILPSVQRSERGTIFWFLFLYGWISFDLET